MPFCGFRSDRRRLVVVAEDDQLPQIAAGDIGEKVLEGLRVDRQEPSEALAAKTARLKEKLAKLGEEMQRLKGLEALMLAAPDEQISLTDPEFPLNGD